MVTGIERASFLWSVSGHLRQLILISTSFALAPCASLLYPLDASAGEPEPLASLRKALPPGWVVADAALRVAQAHPTGYEPSRGSRVLLVHRPDPDSLVRNGYLWLWIAEAARPRDGAAERAQYLGSSRQGHVFLEGIEDTVGRWGHAAHDIAVSLDVRDPAPRKPDRPDWGRLVCRILAQCHAQSEKTESLRLVCRHAALTPREGEVARIALVHNLKRPSDYELDREEMRADPRRPYYCVRLSIRPRSADPTSPVPEASEPVDWRDRAAVRTYAARHFHADILTSVYSDDTRFREAMARIIDAQVRHVLSQATPLEAKQRPPRGLSPAAGPLAGYDIVWRGTVRPRGKVVVHDDQSLFIAPGTRVVIEGEAGFSIRVRGELFAVGSREKPIIFVGKEGRQGLGIRFERATAIGVVEHCSFYNARPAVYCKHASPVVRRNIIAHDLPYVRHGLVCEDGAAPLIEGNTMKGTRVGVVVVNARPTIRNNVFEGYIVGIQVARPGDLGPAIGHNTMRKVRIGVLDERARNHLDFRLLMKTEDIKSVTSMWLGEEDRKPCVNLNTWSGTFRLAHRAEGGYALQKTSDRKNKDGGIHGQTRGLVTSAHLKPYQARALSALCWPTALSQLGRAGCNDTPEDLVALYEPDDRGGKVRWLSDYRERGKFYILPVDLDQDGVDEIVAAQNGGCDQMGRIRVYGLPEEAEGYGPVNVRKQATPTGTASGTRDQLERLYSPDPAVRAEAAAALGSVEDARSAIPFLVAMLGDWQLIESGAHKGSAPGELASRALAQIGTAAVRPLLAALRHAEWNVRQGAERALRRTADDRLLDTLVEALSARDASIREEAAKALGWTGSPNAVGNLIRCLKDSEKPVREAARSALRQLCDHRALAPLLEALRDESPAVRKEAASLLGRIGDPRAAEPLAAALDDKDVDVRVRAVRALYEIGNETANEAIVKALRHSDTDKKVREAASFRCWGRDPRSIPLLRAMLEGDMSPDTRMRVLGRLAELGHPDAVDILRSALTDENSSVREQAAFILGRRGDVQAVAVLASSLRRQLGGLERYSPIFAQLGEAAVEPLTALLRDGNVYARRNAASVLNDMRDPGVLGPRVLTPLIAALADADREVRQHVAFALATLRDPRACEPLVRMLVAGRSAPSAAQALGHIGDHRAVPSLIAALRHQDSLVRRYAARALGEFRDPRAIDPLIAALGDEKSWVSNEAGEALRKLTGEAIEPDQEEWRGWWSQIREPSENLDALIPRLADSEGRVRRRAIWTLSQMLEPAALDALTERFVNHEGGVPDGQPLYDTERQHRRDWPVLRAALVGTGRPGIKKLIRLSGYAWPEREGAAELVVRLSSSAAELLIAALGSADVPAKVGAARILARLRLLPAVPALVKVAGGLRAPSAAAFDALLCYGPEAAPRLRKAAAGPGASRTSRVAAALALRKLGEPAEQPVLEGVVTRGSGPEMNLAVARMGQLARPEFLPLIEMALARPDVEHVAVSAAGRCGGGRAIPLLQKALVHRSPEVRRAARAWIERLAAPHAEHRR